MLWICLGSMSKKCSNMFNFQLFYVVLVLNMFLNYVPLCAQAPHVALVAGGREGVNP
jgi:hypothetical protein